MRGVGRPRVPPMYHEDGRKRAGDYVLGAVRIQAETAGKPGDFLNGADNRLADSWLQEATRPVEGTMMAVAGGELLPEVLDDADMDQPSALSRTRSTSRTISPLTPAETASSLPTTLAHWSLGLISPQRSRPRTRLRSFLPISLRRTTTRS